MNRKRVFLVAGAALILVVVFASYFAWQVKRARNVYSGTVETREIHIGSKVGGRVSAVPVEEGRAVTAGSLLVAFECDDLKAQRAEAAASVTQAQANLDRMVRGNRPEEIEQAVAAAETSRAALEESRNGPRIQEISQAQAAYAAAQADSINADTNFHRMEKLLAADTISHQEFDNAKNKRDSALQLAEAARQKLAELQAGTRPEDLASAESRYKQAQAAAVLSRKGSRSEDITAARAQLAGASSKLEQIDVALREAQLTAPADGIVETVSVRAGDLVPPSRIVLTMLESDQLWIKVYIPETDLARVHVGQSAAIQVDGLPSRVFDGHVGQIASQAEFLPRNVQTPDDRQHQVFAVKVFSENAAGVLKSGMSATVRLR